MKFFNIMAIATICCLLGCETEVPNTEYPINASQHHAVKAGGIFDYPDNQLVIRYEADITEAEKQIMRDLHGVIEYKNCTCADPSLELWIFEPPRGGGSGGSIEDKLIVVKDDDGLEGVDFNPKIQHGGTKLQNPFGPANFNIGLTKVATGNAGVTIAVLDTGIDYNYFGFDQPFLYDVSYGGKACVDNNLEDHYGWDFVNQDNDPYDDYGHGTIVSSIITGRLFANNIDFQILPVKVFDETGNGNYFDILCGFKYAVNNEDVDIVNMSFGWYNMEYEILSRFVEESEEVALLTTSAGNDIIDNDLFPHYPSSYDTNNVLANAALSESMMGISLGWFSNWGQISVDIAAPGENLPFYLSPNESILVSGTSYSNAIISAYAAASYDPGMTVAQLRSFVLSSAVYSPNLDNIKYSSFILY